LLQSHQLLEALQIQKFSLKQQYDVAFDFMEGFIIREEDYSIDGILTPFAIEEFLSRSKLNELHDLLLNAEEAVSEPCTQS